MKKFFGPILITVAALCTMTSCGNKDMWDTVYTYNNAIISLPNGEVIEGKVDSWTDYEDGEQIQVKLKDGKTYLVHSEDIVLIQN